MSIRVIIGDDHPVVRDGLRLTIENGGEDIVVVGEAADGLEVLAMARTNPADVFILDVTMPNMNGVDTARELLKRLPHAKIIMLSLHDTKAIVEEALEAGARGYLTKEMATRMVVEAVIEVHAGRHFLCPRIAHFVRQSALPCGATPRKGAAPTALTAQERKVLQLIAEGRSTREIATILEVSSNTIHAHRNHVMAKLNIHKQAALVRYAIKAGIAKL
jgi:DNA-binding NarL/FixJ family response regulator